MFSFKKIIFLIFTVCLLSSALYSTILNVPGTYSTIQAGIDASANTDTVLVQPGTYVENINFNGKLITLGSLFLTTGDESYIASTIIDGNAASRVVTFANGEDLNAVLKGFTITNGSTTWGGGIYINGASPTLKNLIITGNTASFAGGGISCYNCSPTLINVEIVDNIANNRAGGVNCENNSDPTLENVTIVGNTATYYGGGIFCDTNSSPIVINSILWNNSQQQIHLNLSSITVTYSNIQGGYTGTSNIDADPLFVDPANGDYHLTENSPCIDTGDPDPQYNDLDGTFADIGAYYFYHLAPPVANFTSDKISGMVPLTVNFTDITSHGSGVIDEWYWDFGDGTNSSLQHPAHVYQSQGVYSVSLIVTADDDSTDTMAKTDYITVTDRIWYISTTGSNTTGDGSEEFPFKTIQHGIDVSSNTDIVLVQPGTYVENINYNGKRITLGSLFLTTQDTTYISSTIIDGDASGSVVIFESSENLLAILTGFTITNGGTTDGGGIFCDHASPTLKNLIILDNTATDDGGGIFCDHASPTLKNLKVAGNSANSSGGGIYCAYYSSPSIESVEILNNSADWGGGIFIVNFSNPSLENVNISNNFAVHNGGGIYIEGISNPNLESVSIINNTAGYVGGIACYSSEPSIRNTTIANNYATYRVGGIHCGNNAYPTLENVTITGNDTGSSRDCIILSDSYSCPNLINTILWHNNYHYDIAGPFTATYSNIESGFIGTGNISSDPLFVDVANGDYHLQPTSPSIDTGDPNSPLDPDGSRAEMGAYYYHQYDIPPTAKFNSNLSQGYSPLSVDFTDISTHGSVEIDEWYWDFGDGENSTVQNPTHIFSDLGYYTISLTVTDVNDSTDTEIKTDFIAVSADEQPAAPANVNISNTGNDVILNWDKVDTSVLGNFVYTDYYLIYNSASPNSNYSFLDLTTETNYTHQHITQFGDKNFYQVSAYVGELRLLQSVIAENPNFKLGELDFLIEEKRKRNSLK